MYDRILLPTDGSDASETATEHALWLAEQSDATLSAVSVVDSRVYRSADSDQQGEITETLKRDATESVESVADRAAAAGVTCETAVLDGVPDTEILRFADEIDADLLVMGTHGRTGRERLANLGSVTERVVTGADRPTLVVTVEDD
ncbi:universal stress protein [Salinirubrum litoreum]|uniref:Universal stress protein n=1 Tax=Salinirubrum litoreum TaxID=1126234 RepID=A0ABD5RD98_9EURY|nr:universal stress protein [Salinirubrum litoreum]